MAPLPFNNTDILFVDYSTQGHQHTLQCRYATPNSAADAMTAVDDLLTAISNALGLTTIIGARFQNQGENVSQDIAWTGASAYGDGIGSEYQSAFYYDYVGRSAGGRRVRVAIFGGDAIQAGDNYRADVGESPNLAAGLAVLDAAEGVFLAIDGTQPVWKRYINLGVNAYWRNKIR